MVYFSILYFRYHAGTVTDKMLSLPKGPYVAIGLLEAISAVSGMAATGRKPLDVVMLCPVYFQKYNYLISQTAQEFHG